MRPGTGAARWPPITEAVDHPPRAGRGQPRRVPARPRHVAEQPVHPAERHRRPRRRPGLHHRSRRPSTGELAAANPAAFLPDLAASLNNLSVRQSGTGDRTGALASITEAVAIRRELAAANPAAFLPDLASSLQMQADLVAADDGIHIAVSAWGDAVDQLPGSIPLTPARLPQRMASAAMVVTTMLTPTSAARCI